MKALLHTFTKDRREALLSFDEEKIIAFCDKYGAEVPPKSHPNYDKIFWGGVAKAVLHLPDIPVTAEKKARDILTEYGFSSEIGRRMHW